VIELCIRSVTKKAKSNSENITFGFDEMYHVGERQEMNRRRCGHRTIRPVTTPVREAVDLG